MIGGKNIMKLYRGNSELAGTWNYAKILSRDGSTNLHRNKVESNLLELTILNNNNSHRLID